MTNTNTTRTVTHVNHAGNTYKVIRANGRIARIVHVTMVRKVLASGMVLPTSKETAVAKSDPVYAAVAAA